MSAWRLVPVEPSDALLWSMAIRYDHGLGCPGYYDQPLMARDGITHEMRLKSAMTTMRQLHEEVVGTGSAAAPDPTQDEALVERLAKEICETLFGPYNPDDATLVTTPEGQARLAAIRASAPWERSRERRPPDRLARQGHGPEPPQPVKSGARSRWSP